MTESLSLVKTWQWGHRGGCGGRMGKWHTPRPLGTGKEILCLECRQELGACGDQRQQKTSKLDTLFLCPGESFNIIL